MNNVVKELLMQLLKICSLIVFYFVARMAFTDHGIETADNENNIFCLRPQKQNSDRC